MQTGRYDKKIIRSPYEICKVQLSNESFLFLRRMPTMPGNLKRPKLLR